MGRRMVSGLLGGARARQNGLRSVQGVEVTLHLSQDVMEPPLLGNAVGPGRSEASSKPQRTHLVLSLLQAGTGATREIQNRVYFTCNLKELTVFGANQSQNSVLDKSNLILLPWHACQEETEGQNSNCL